MKDTPSSWEKNWRKDDEQEEEGEEKHTYPSWKNKKHEKKKWMGEHFARKLNELQWDEEEELKKERKKCQTAVVHLSSSKSRTKWLMTTNSTDMTHTTAEEKLK